MTIRKTWRLLCLAAASFFWASCSNDSSTQPSESESPDSDSSADVNGDDSSSNSSEAVSSSSAATVGDKSSQSAAGESASSSVEYVLASDPSVTCEKITQQVNICGSVGKGLTCDDYERYLKKDTTLSQKILTGWEEALETCGAIQETVALYGVAYNVCSNPYAEVPAMKCSDGNTYTRFELDGNKVSISSSSSAEEESSSSVAEDAVTNCPQEGFALFADILAEVQKELYAQVSAKITEGTDLSNAQKEYLEGLLDRDNQTLKGNLSPYLTGEVYDVKYQSLSYESEEWFNGYIAKTKTCANGSPETTEKYQQKYDAILAECLALIENRVKSIN